ncbi:hypothetical protein [Pedobacter nyackensis]|uniref:Uncharacterized protein n=1 Tax=Pedobacter nyackensis TaxID=475255 RepID=A0A1W2EZA7_9SPHI|nr:hypothetical protein [Pedobacter nyackensis]SMD14568.1 hypothetical protein SAMN04488101_117105 [Pedobacter nyackensis]
MKPALKCLYYLENSEHCILEIKRTDLADNADLSEIFRWLFLDKKTQEIQSLTFRSMDSSGEVQERFFEQGYLKFNDHTATYIEKFNSAQHQLENHTGTPLPPEILDILTAYLRN